MIRLTRRSGEIEIINPDRIEKIEDAHADGGSRIIFASGDNHAYAETRDEVARKVLEWRLAMERYGAGVFAEAKETGEEAKMLAWARNVEYRIMLNLAGLEEPKNAHQ